MATSGELETLIEDRRLNTILGWTVIGFVGIVVVESVLSADLAWAVFAAGVLLLAVIPPLGFRDREAMLPWEVLVLGTLPLIGRAVSSTLLTTRLATYLSVAGLALIVAVELDVFTSVKMTTWFAVLFVVAATMATAGVWAVLRWSADVWLGTTLLLKPGVSEEVIETGVMWEFVYSTIAGVIGGVVFEWYFRQRSRGRDRLPTEVVDRIR